jgi:hypothetical protein
MVPKPSSAPRAPWTAHYPFHCVIKVPPLACVFFHQRRPLHPTPTPWGCSAGTGCRDQRSTRSPRAAPGGRGEEK